MQSYLVAKLLTASTWQKRRCSPHGETSSMPDTSLKHNRNPLFRHLCSGKCARLPMKKTAKSCPRTLPGPSKFNLRPTEKQDSSGLIGALLHVTLGAWGN